VIRLPVGFENFREIIDSKFEYVDKSLLVKELMDDTAKIVVFTRPRRFGKTLNMSMLQHFFANTVAGLETRGLFNHLKITTFPEYMKHQGQYPVISISFKDIKEDTFQQAYDKFYELLIEVYSQHLEVMESNKLQAREKELCRLLLSRQATRAQVENALKTLTTCVCQHYGVNPLLLIDEYDTPIQAGFNGGYYEEIIAFTRNVLSAALKGNPYLFRGVLTGILRVSKESLFSGLNNLEVYSLLRSEYGQFFGFTEPETEDLLKKANLEHTLPEIKHWYNGYQSGEIIVYNPWSIVNCIKRQGAIELYWVNTSDNILVKKLLSNASQGFKEQLEFLLNGDSIERIIDENIVFGDLKTNESAIWSLLVMTGYLKVSTRHYTEQGSKCQLKIPNQEVRSLYRNIIEQWLSNGFGIEWYNQFLTDFLNGNMIAFEAALQKIMLQIVGIYDFIHEPEAFYHGLLLGLIASLDKTKYLIKSNKESGLGRYDILIIPKEPNLLGIILELKSIKIQKSEKELRLESRLTEGALEALEQITKGHYISELEQQGVRNILKIGLAFSGKQFKLEYQKI